MTSTLKKHSFGYAFFLLLPFLFPFSLEPIPIKRALIIGISTYAPQTKWKDIHSLNDILIIEKALLAQHFAPKDILILKDEEATKSGIQMALKNHFASLKKGDFAYFHFSGHGQQLPDRNGDELDKKDEALVPYDAHKRYNPSKYKGEKHLLDDELKELLDNIRRKLGPKGQLMVTIDACHSGSATRTEADLSIARGSLNMMGDKNDVKKTNSKISDPSFFSSESKEEAKNLAPLILFSATSQDELNYEVIPQGQTEYFGPLSYAFGTAFPKVNETTSYEAFYDEIKSIMSSFKKPQSPVAEGKLDRAIFSGQFKGKSAHYKVVQQNEKNATINGGRFAGILPGTEIAFHPQDTWQTEGLNPICRGIVESAEFSSANVVLQEKASAPLKNSWAYVEAVQFGKLEFGIRIETDDLAFLNAMEKQIGLVRNFKISKQNPHIVIRKKEGKPILVFQTNDVDITPKSLNKVPLRKQASMILDKALLPYARAQYLRAFSFKDKYIDVRMEIIPIRKEKDVATGKIIEVPIKAETKMANGNFVFQYGDFIKIKFTNKGKKTAYLSLYDIQPNGKVTELFPWKERSKSECKLAAGDSIVSEKRWKVGPPKGLEVFKLIALSTPADVLQPYTRNGRSILPNPPTKGGNRSSDLFKGAVPSNSANVHSLTFTIQADN